MEIQNRYTRFRDLMDRNVFTRSELYNICMSSRADIYTPDGFYITDKKFFTEFLSDTLRTIARKKIEAYKQKINTDITPEKIDTWNYTGDIEQIFKKAKKNGNAKILNLDIIFNNELSEKCNNDIFCVSKYSERYLIIPFEKNYFKFFSNDGYVEIFNSLLIFNDSLASILKKNDKIELKKDKTSTRNTEINSYLKIIEALYSMAIKQGKVTERAATGNILKALDDAGLSLSEKTISTIKNKIALNFGNLPAPKSFEDVKRTLPLSMEELDS